MTKQSNYPPGWNKERVLRVLEYYESQSEDEAVAEDEAAYEDNNQTFMKIQKGFYYSNRTSRDEKDERIQSNTRGIA